MKLARKVLAVAAAGAVLTPTAAGAADPDRILATKGAAVVDVRTGERVSGVAGVWSGWASVAQSPDGSRLAVGSASSTWRELGQLFLSGADGACPTQMPTVDDVRGVSWAPDSVRLALGYHNEVRVLDTGRPGAAPARFAPVAVEGSYPSWHPSAERIAFSRFEPGGDTDLAVVVVGTGATTTVVDTPLRESQPAWSPDGTQLAFIRYRSDQPPEESTLHVVNADGTGERALGSAVLDPRSPSWSRDGRSLLVSGGGGLDSGGVWRVDVGTGGATRLTSDGHESPIEAPLGPRTGYVTVTTSGEAHGFGASCGAGPATGLGPVVAAVAAPGRPGHWQVDAAGRVRSVGGQPKPGDLAGRQLRQPIVGMMASPDGNGYWLVGRDGGVFSFGSAGFHGSTASLRLNQPIVGGAATPSGKGYWLVAADGGIFSFGDARFFGSTGGRGLNAPIVGMQRTSSGAGYWLVAGDGGVFSFGDAAFHGSAGAVRLNQPITGMATDPDGKGYWLVAADGGIFSFGSARYRGSTGGTPANSRTVAVLGERFG